MRGARLKVSNDTEIHMSTTYSRNKKKKKSVEEKAYNFVIKGLMIGASLVGMVVTQGFGVTQASAASNTPTPPVDKDIVAQTVVKDDFSDEKAMISNLKMANKMLEAGINNGQLSASMYSSVMKALTSIETKLSMNQQFVKIADLEPILATTDTLLSIEPSSTDADLLKNRDTSITALQSVQDKISTLQAQAEDDIPEYNFDEKKVSTVKADEGEKPTLLYTTASTSPVAKATIKYDDLKTDQYWSNDMLWAIEKGYMKGYINTVHPTDPSKGKGNWLNPNGTLTENQLLSVIFRYVAPSKADKVDNYQLAKDYGIKTKASLTNKAPSVKATTRGTLAQALASVYFGKSVTVEQGVQFMYDAGLSSGVNPSKGETFSNFGVNDSLKRAHIVSFIKGYDNLIKSGKQIKLSQASNGSSDQDSGQEVAGIKTQYGKHIYGSKNQAQYDQVMKIVKDQIANTKWNGEFSSSGDLDTYVHKYIDGARPVFDPSHPNYNTDENYSLVAVSNFAKDLVENGADAETISKALKGANISVALLSKATVKDDGTPRSAYDALVNKVRDCDPDAYVQSAVFDALGFNTVVIARPGHASALYEVDGNWYVVGANTIIDLDNALKTGNYYLEAPTY